MDVSKINTTVLRNLLSLTKRRDAVLRELSKVEAAIADAYAGGRAAVVAAVTGKSAATGKRRGRPAKVKAKAVPASASAPAAKRGKRGALKGKILAALKEAGDKGVSVKDLSKQLKVKNQNVHVWFSSTGKKLGTIQKVGAGRYRLKKA